MSEPNEPTPPPRIILPGAEDDAPRETPRIILPPGAVPDSREDVPEYPRLRAVQIHAMREGERELIVITDPLGVAPQQLVLGMETLAILEMLDGTTSMHDITATFMRESKDLRVGNILRDFIGKLDDFFLLEGPKFEAAYQKLQSEWHPLEERTAALADVCYPADHEALERFLDEQFAHTATRMAEAGETAATGTELPRAILAPHLDPRRRGHVQARAFSTIGPDVGLPLRVIVFGTGHQLHQDMVALTRKDFTTPFGTVPCDRAFVDHVAAALGDTAYSSELVHRDEHSIEFILLYLQRRLKYRRFTLVPILVGGFERFLEEGRTPREDATIGALVRSVREAEQQLGGPTLYVASVDFSHVGPSFGDPPLDEEALGLVERMDERAIGAAASGDAEQWYDALAAEENATRICGFAPTYCMLRCAEPGPGIPLLYDQSPQPGGVVSVAAMVWPRQVVTA